MTDHRKGTVDARVIEVIESTHLVGAGVNGDPVRQITTYHDLTGRLLAEIDNLYDPDPAEQDAYGARHIKERR